MKRTHLCAVVGLILGLVSAELAAQDDTAPARPRDIVRTADRKILPNVTVISETPTEVMLDTTGDGKADKTLDQNEVKDIQYDQAPNEYVQAVALYRVSNYDKAIEMFNQATAKGGRRWIKDYSTYYTAMCQARKAEADPTLAPVAVRAFEELLKNPNNRWRDDARYELGQIQLARGDRAAAKTTFETLTASAHREEMKLTASVGLAALLMAENKPAEALQRYNTVVQGAEKKFPELYLTATVGKAQAHTALGEYTSAEEFLKKILDSEEDRTLRAKAHLALGDCYYVQATAQEAKDPKDAPAVFKEALNQYLWVIVVYSDEKAEYAKSLYYAGECWKKLDEPLKARELHNELRSKFGTTKWAGMVRGG